MMGNQAAIASLSHERRSRISEEQVRQIDLEAKVLSIIERVEKAQPIEDSLVECKAEWIDPVKAARRLAGHANAARGEPVLWLMGVNEKANTVEGVKAQDFADWWSQVVACFDGMPPGVYDLNVPHGEKTVVALWLETDRGPFVVKNPNGGAITREVPWREGTAVRTARREDLIMLLAPVSHLPSAEVLAFEIHSGTNPHAVTYMYLTPSRIGEMLVFPYHRMEVMLVVDGQPRVHLSNVTASPPTNWVAHGADFFPEEKNLSATLQGTASELLVQGPGKAIVRGWPGLTPLPSSDMRVKITMGLAGSSFPLVVEFKAIAKPPATATSNGSWDVVPI